MKYIYLALNWVFGVLFGLTGIVSLFEVPLGGLCLIVMACLLLPPVRAFIYSKTKKQLPFKARAITIVVLFIAFGIFAGQQQTRQEAKEAAAKAESHAQKIAEIKQDNINFFQSHKTEIIDAISAALSKNKYNIVLSQYKKYLPANDADLDKLYSKAKTARKDAEREAKTKEIVAKLKNIPASKLAKNKKLYGQLLDLNPENATFQHKFDYYSNKLDEKLARQKAKKEKAKKERKARIAKFGKPPVASAWDGSYYVVEQYLEKIARNPDSIEIDGCTDVYYTKGGWLVGCNYRGQNGFGGMTRTAKWFTIRHGRVIKMEKSSAYNP